MLNPLQVLPPPGQNPLGALALWATGAAMVAALGPFLWTKQPGARPRSQGFFGGLATGAMLGVAYPLMNAGLARAGILAMIGAVMGLAASYGTHIFLGVGTSETIANPNLATAANTLHAAPEGVAIGSAMAIAPRFGLFLVITLAIHNVWESAVLSSCLFESGFTRARAAVYGVVTNVSQVILAIGAYAVAIVAPGTLPALLGVSFGSLVYLCLAELLPDSYRAAGRTSMAVVVSVAAGVVALLGGVA